MSSTSKTDWTRIDAMTEAEIDTSDIPPLSEEFFASATLRLPSKFPSQSIVSISVDNETLQWFQAQDQEFEKRMAAALRIYAQTYQVSQIQK
jgi:uncharacterized protein (DUF4415 family)